MGQLLYADESDRLRHQTTISALADSMHLPVHVVAHIYEAELAKLCDHAKIKDYLSMLTVKHVKLLLSGSDSPEDRRG